MLYDVARPRALAVTKTKRATRGYGYGTPSFFPPSLIQRFHGFQALGSRSGVLLLLLQQHICLRQQPSFPPFGNYGSPSQQQQSAVTLQPARLCITGQKLPPPTPSSHTALPFARRALDADSPAAVANARFNHRMSNRGLILTLQSASAAACAAGQAAGRAVGLGEQQVVHLLQLLQHTMRLMVPTTIATDDDDGSRSLWRHLVASRDRDRVLQVLVVCAERVVSGDGAGSDSLRERVWLVTALNRKALAKATQHAFPAGHADDLRDGLASAVAALDAVAFNIAFSHSSPEQLAFPDLQPHTVMADPCAVVSASAQCKVPAACAAHVVAAALTCL